MNQAVKACEHAGCDVAVSGTCALKHDPVESCPNFPSNDIELDDEEVDVQSATTAKVERIYSSDVMLLDDLARFMKERQIAPVALIGEQRAGKTTLLASIFGMFCKGPFGGMSFAGSRTLVGFAKLHHSALLSCGKSSPKVPRTSRNDPLAFFHLAMQRGNGEVVDLVISDRSGEVYGDARKDTDLISDLTELQVAGRVCFLLDGAKLASNEKRTAYARQFKQMIHALLDNGALLNVKNVEVVSTKFDVTNAKGNSEEHTKYLDEYERQIESEFSAKGLAVKCYRICALPKSDVSIGFKGLDELLIRWTEAVSPRSVTPTPLEGAARQIDKFQSRIENGAV